MSAGLGDIFTAAGAVLSAAITAGGTVTASAITADAQKAVAHDQEKVAFQGLIDQANAELLQAQTQRAVATIEANAPATSALGASLGGAPLGSPLGAIGDLLPLAALALLFAWLFSGGSRA